MSTTRQRPDDDALDDELPRDDEESPGTEEELPLDTVFDILSSERRRRVLEHLTEASDGTTLGALAETIASQENDKPVAEITSQERKRVYVGLYQCHLPRMDDADVIEFESDRKTVELGPQADRLLPYIERCEEAEAGESGDDRWAPFYLGASLVGALALLVQTFVFPIAWLSGLLVNGLVLAFFSLSIVHARSGGLPSLRAVGQ